MIRKLIIVSNRLPFKIVKRNGKLEMQKSSGGLVSAIESSLKSNDNVVWVGVANFTKELWEEFREKSKHEHFPIVPLFLDKKLEKNFYDGFSNTVIWPLFHYFPSYAEFNEHFFEAYKKVNELFSETIRSFAEAQDTVWIHDYHLMLLPALIKDQFSVSSVGFFLHIPFPSYEILKTIPENWRNSILINLLHADVIGFQTKEYVSHFKRSLSYFLGVEMHNQSVNYLDNTCIAKHYPISIDFEKFNSAYDLPEVVKGRTKIREIYKGMKLIFSLDRLDYTKGVINRLQAFEEVLAENPNLRGQITFIINVIPSRELHKKYAEKRKAIEERIGHINGLYGNVYWQPIIYQYGNLSFSQLMIFYSVCHVALVTPLRDGMNLVAKEFVASRKDKAGTLILGEFAGASEELKEAIILNPNDIESMKVAIIRALEMSEKEQYDAIASMQATISTNDVKKWTADFLIDLKYNADGLDATRLKIMSFDERMDLFETFKNASRRLILLDYDGTLVNFCDDPNAARPSQRTLDLLVELSKNAANKIVIISGRTTASLDDFFSELPIEFVAEHGCFFKPSSNEQWIVPVSEPENWKPGVFEIFEKYVQQIPESSIEEKKHSISWHFRKSKYFNEEEIIGKMCKELSIHNATGEFNVLCGNKIVEVKNSHFSKGKFVTKYLEKNDFDFVLAIGDDTTDEDMFAVLQKEHQFSIRVGLTRTRANFNLIGVSNVISFLEQLSMFKNILVKGNTV